MSQKMTEPLCENCAFHGQAIYDAWWVCRRYPPKAYENQPDRLASFPAIDRHGWCGEFRARSGGAAKWCS